MPRPKKPLCEVCTQPMTRFIQDGEDVWKCTNVKAHDIAVATRRVRPGKKNTRRDENGKFT